MKTLITLAIAFSCNFAHAYVEDTMDLAACADVAPFAVLTKDNMPYWSASTDANKKAACYQTVKTVIENGSGSDLDDLEATFDGQVVITTTDEQFAEFVNANDNGTSDFTVESNKTTLMPVFKGKTVFFKN